MGYVQGEFLKAAWVLATVVTVYRGVAVDASLLDDVIMVSLALLFLELSHSLTGAGKEEAEEEDLPEEEPGPIRRLLAGKYVGAGSKED